jgi:hypothetical protein
MYIKFHPRLEMGDKKMAVVRKVESGKRRLSNPIAGSRRIMPRLDTIEMIETTIKSKKYFESKTKLWKALPRGVQYRTLGTVLAYLERSNKIVENKDGSIVWIFVEGARARKSLRESIEV